MSIFGFLKKTPIRTAEVTQKSPANHEDTKKGSATSATKSPLRKPYPSKNGLFPNEILMLSYADTYTNSKNTFQNFWNYEYGIKDPQKMLDSLLSRGFIQLEDIHGAVSRLKVSELKEYLSKIGEKTTGKKADLIERVLSGYETQELEKLFTVRHYCVTNIGQFELEENPYVLYLLRHKYMSPQEMNILLHYENPAHQGYRDIIWREFNRKSAEHASNLDFGLYRNTRLDMSSFLFEEKKYKTALSLLVEVISFDLSGLGNNEKTFQVENEHIREILCNSRLSNLYSEDGKNISLYPAIKGRFEELYRLLDMPSNEFIAFVYGLFSEVTIHERVFTASECANIALAAIGLEDLELPSNYLIAKNRVKAKYH